MLEITVCVNPDGCLGKKVLARRDEGGEPREYGPREILEVLREIVRTEGLDGKVRLHEKVCLWGCTFGPRIDVVKGETRVYLYGRQDYRGPISVRGKVQIRGISNLPSLRSIIHDHL